MIKMYISEHHRKKIIKGLGDEIPSERLLLDMFESYLQDYEDMRIKISGFDKRDSKYKTISTPMLNRWQKRYQRRVLAKFYKLNKWFQQNKCVSTMVTLTTKQRGLNHLEQFEKLRVARMKFVELVRKMKGKQQYVYVVEPHKSGMMHVHILYFCTFSRSEQKRLKNWWNGKADAGGYANAVKFDRSKKINSIDNVKNYLMKYLQKTLSEDSISDKGHKLFSAFIWYATRKDTKWHGVRFYGTSRDLSRFIKLENVSDFVVDCVYLLESGNEPILIYENEHFDEFVNDFLDFYKKNINI